MEQVIKAKGGKGPGAGRTALVSPVLALYYFFSGTCMALGWVMAAGIALAIVLEVLGGGTMMVMAFLLGRQAGFTVGLFLFGLGLWLIVAPTFMLTREVFIGMKTITKYYIKKSGDVTNRLLGKPLNKNISGEIAL